MLVEFSCWFSHVSALDKQEFESCLSLQKPFVRLHASWLLCDHTNGNKKCLLFIRGWIMVFLARSILEWNLEGLSGFEPVFPLAEHSLMFPTCTPPTSSWPSRIIYYLTLLIMCSLTSSKGLSLCPKRIKAILCNSACPSLTIKHLIVL